MLAHLVQLLVPYLCSIPDWSDWNIQVKFLHFLFPRCVMACCLIPMITRDIKQSVCRAELGMVGAVNTIHGSSDTDTGSPCMIGIGRESRNRRRRMKAANVWIS